MDDRKAFEAMVYMLRRGMQWNALPREVGASSTVHDRFQEWERAGFFKALWQAGLSEYDDLAGIQWEWQAVDGVMRHLPLSPAPRPEPTPPIPANEARNAASRPLGPGSPTGAATACVRGCCIRLCSGVAGTARAALPAARPQSGGRETRERVHPWLSCPPLGGGTHAFLAQSLPSALGSVGEEERELSRLPSLGLRSTDLC